MMHQAVVLDTCALLFLFTDSSRLSTSVKNQIDQYAILLPISFAEIACKVKLGKLKLGGYSTQNLLEEIQSVNSIEIIPTTANMWIEAINLEWPEHIDPADRLIVSYAKLNQLPIVTTDRRINHYYPNCLQ